MKWRREKPQINKNKDENGDIITKLTKSRASLENSLKTQIQVNWKI
jgi:hypothetical protein